MMDPDDFRACLISMGYDLVMSAFSPGQSMTLTAFFFALTIMQKHKGAKSTFFYMNSSIIFLG